MVDKEQTHKSDNALEDMMSSLPEDLPKGANGAQPEVAPITIPDMEVPHIPSPEEIRKKLNKNKKYASEDVMKLILGEDNPLADELLKKKPEDTNFSNMSLANKDVEYVKKYFGAYRITLAKDIPQPVAVIKLGGRTIATVADMTTITGKAKARKSYFLSAVITAAMNPTYYNGTLEVNLPPGRNKIIWIDTEQSEYWSQQILHRVRRTGVEAKEIDNRIIYLNCRDLSIDQLKAMVYISLERHSTESAFCIIDGSRDLVSSVNNEDEATQLARWLPEMAKKYKINITSVLHQNPSGDKGSKLRGHLGTELMNKSEFVVVVEQHPKDKEVFIAGTMLSRDIGSEEVCFMIKDGLLEFVGEPVDNKSEKTKFMYDRSIDQLKKMTVKIYMTHGTYNQKNLAMAIQSHLIENHDNLIGIQKIISEWVPYLENKGLIAIDEDKASKNGQAKFYKKNEFADTETVEAEVAEPPEIEDSDDLPF